MFIIYLSAYLVSNIKQVCINSLGCTVRVIQIILSESIILKLKQFS